MTLGGNVSIRNGIELDYCFEEAIESLLPVCDEVVVCDGESTDGTWEFLLEWVKREPKLKLCAYPWPNPKGNIAFWVDWLNYTREHIKSDFHIQLDADEILSESSYAEIEKFKQRPADTRMSLWCHRYNFWRDACHLIPHGVTLSHRVCRVAPTNVWLPSDGPEVRGGAAIGMAVNSNIEIFHYGFLRRRDAYFRKSRQLHGFFFNTYDQRLVDAEAKDGNWMEKIENVEWINRVIPFKGKHPVVIQPWLKKHGYDPEAH